MQRLSDRRTIASCGFLFAGIHGELHVLQPNKDVSGKKVLPPFGVLLL
jgi:hypothetical protein